MKANLPLHMVPSRIVFLDSLPYNKGNKVDREALRKYFLPIRNDGIRKQPQTETEMLLADIWAEIFELHDIRQDDDFFDLGGDSLSGTLVAARIHAALGVKLTIGEIADHPTIFALAAFIDASQRAGFCGSPPPLVSAPRLAPMPAAPVQELVWNHPEHRVALT